MKVDIWSDVVCPYCYIGKREFENALKQFEFKDEVEVVWHSFQLDHFIKFKPGRSIYEYLSEHNGISIHEAKEMVKGIQERADRLGLELNYDIIIPANTLDAHRLLHLALEMGFQEKAEELMFRAYFTEGQNIADKQTLQKLGLEIGLDSGHLTNLLNSDQFIEEVELDFHEARVMGIRGVPFFLFNSKYSVSGAQESSYFMKVLIKAWSEKRVNI